MKSAAVFLDRDGTLIEDPGYLADAAQVRLLPGAAEAIKRWNQAGYRLVVVTNQSGLARGVITENQLEDIHTQLELLLEEHGARLDALYFCPYLDGPEAVVPKYRRDSHLRKPRPGMLQKAADELNLDLTHSWMVGNSVKDVQAGLAAGCRTVLILNGRQKEPHVDADFQVESISDAVKAILGNMTRTPALSTSTAPVALEMTPSTGSEPQAETTLTVLKDIRALLQQHRRDESQRDFSLARLGATLFQFVAIAVLLWALAAFADQEGSVDALARLTLAGVVQLIALTLLLTDRSR